VALDPGDRIETGRSLLARFLTDSRIQGLTPDGVVYDHHVASRMCERFLSGFQKITLRGTV
jgi:hypothetical protein